MVVANDLRDIQQDDHRLFIVNGDLDVALKTKNTEPVSLADGLVKEILSKTQTKG